MSQEYFAQAVREAVGEKAFSEATMNQINQRKEQLSKVSQQDGDDLELGIQALRETFGTGVINPNVETQLRSRYRALEQSGGKAGQPGDPNQNNQVPPPVHNVGPNLGSPNQPQEPATPEEVKQQAGVKQHPEYGEKTRHIGMPEGAKVPGQNPQNVSLKEGVEGDINAQQKAQFEKDQRAGTHGSGGNSADAGASARSQGAAATNSGNTGAGGPGAGSMQQTGVGNPARGGATGAPATGTGGTNVGQTGR